MCALQTPLVTLAGHTQPVKTIVWPHEGEVFTAGYDHCIRVWDLESRTTSGTLVSAVLVLLSSYDEFFTLDSKVIRCFWTLRTPFITS